MQRKTINATGAVRTAEVTVSGVTSRKLRVAHFNASYPVSKVLNSTNPLPRGITRNSDWSAPNTAST